MYVEEKKNHFFSHIAFYKPRKKAKKEVIRRKESRNKAGNIQNLNGVLNQMSAATLSNPKVSNFVTEGPDGVILPSLGYGAVHQGREKTTLSQYLPFSICFVLIGNGQVV